MTEEKKKKTAPPPTAGPISRSVDQAILNAMAQGVFDNLPGSGQPLNLENNPFADPDTQAAHHLLRSNGFAPAWIEARAELQAEIRAAEADLRRTWAWVRRSIHSRWALAEWDRAAQAYRERIDDLNKRIRDYNLTAPTLSVHLRPVNPDALVELLRGR